MADEFLLGVNYWPARKFVRMWSRFDAGEIARDFSLIRGLGLRLVRIFLFWPDFQPQPDAVDRAQLDNLATVFDLATRRGLLLMPTLLVGHMSGPNWMPAWAMSDQPNNRPAVYAVDGAVSANKPRDIFGGDAHVFAAQRLLIRSVVERFRKHSALWGWDICNEIDLVQAPETAAGERWLRTIVDDIRTLDQTHPVTAGFVGWPDSVARGFHRESHRLVDVASVHAYPLYDASSAGWGDTAYVRRTIEETRERAGVPVMLAEFGLPVNPEPGTRPVTMTWGGLRPHCCARRRGGRRPLRARGIARGARRRRDGRAHLVLQRLRAGAVRRAAVRHAGPRALLRPVRGGRAAEGDGGGDAGFRAHAAAGGSPRGDVYVTAAERSEVGGRRAPADDGSSMTYHVRPAGEDSSLRSG